MSIGKRFKKKMKNPRAGNSYWRIWGWPLDPYNVPYMKDKYGNDPCWAFYEDVFGTVVLFAEQSFVGAKRHMNGQFHGLPYVRTRTQAIRLLEKIKQGYQPSGIGDLRDFHQMMDDMEAALHDDY